MLLWARGHVDRPGEAALEEQAGAGHVVVGGDQHEVLPPLLLPRCGRPPPPRPGCCWVRAGSRYTCERRARSLHSRSGPVDTTRFDATPSLHELEAPVEPLAVTAREHDHGVGVARAWRSTAGTRRAEVDRDEHRRRRTTATTAPSTSSVRRVRGLGTGRGYGDPPHLASAPEASDARDRRADHRMTPMTEPRVLRPSASTRRARCSRSPPTASR